MEPPALGHQPAARGRLTRAGQEFVCEHAGLARTYDSSNLKRKLRCGITELEERGYLRALSDEERFLNV
jgi:hypothetical protein